MKHVFNFIFALFFFALCVLAFICAKESPEHNIMCYLMGVFFGLCGVKFLCCN